MLFAGEVSVEEVSAAETPVPEVFEAFFVQIAATVAVAVVAVVVEGVVDLAVRIFAHLALEILVVFYPLCH